MQDRFRFRAWDKEKEHIGMAYLFLIMLPEL